MLHFGNICRKLASAFIGILCLSAFCSVAYATDQLDISTGLKTWLLVNDRPQGKVTVAVVYDPSNPSSEADGKIIQQDIGTGVGVPGGLNVVSALVPAGDMKAISAAKIAFLATGLSAEALNNISKTAASSGVLTMSADMTCVQANKCVIGIATKPRVDIYYSAVAAEASHISFAPAFVMLARKI
ncbi:MAG TPA: hypothetical protein VFT64_10005 [Rickettsiales bacterium]|nr:hypothetical protein [Rickettsiales bacterium]